MVWLVYSKSLSACKSVVALYLIEYLTSDGALFAGDLEHTVGIFTPSGLGFCSIRELFSSICNFAGEG